MYTSAEALPITKLAEFIDKKDFVKTVLNAESKTFIVYVVALKAPLLDITIHLSKVA